MTSRYFKPRSPRREPVPATAQPSSTMILTALGRIDAELGIVIVNKEGQSHFPGGERLVVGTPRMAGIVILGQPHHVAQRGNPP